MRSSLSDLTDVSRRCTLLGQRVAVSASDTSAPWIARLDGLLSGFASADPAGGPVARFRVRPGTGGAMWHIESDDISSPVWTDNALLRELEWRVVAAAIRHAALPLVLHAGAVARDGLALLLPAASGSGKTTLTLALAARGWLPLTDDISPLERDDDRWFALPCPRCCHLDVNMIELLVAQGIALEGPVADLAGYYRPVRWAERARVAAIVTPHFAVGSSPSRMPLSQAECLAELITASYEHAEHPRREQRLAARHLAMRLPAFRLTYASVDEALSLVETLVSELERGGSPHAARQPLVSAPYPA